MKACRYRYKWLFCFSLVGTALLPLNSYAYGDDQLNFYGEPKRDSDVWGRGEQGAAIVHGAGCLCLGCQGEQQREAEDRRIEEEKRQREEEWRRKTEELWRETEERRRVMQERRRDEEAREEESRPRAQAREGEEASRRRQFVQDETAEGLDIPAGLSMPGCDRLPVNARSVRQQEEAQRRAQEEYERTRPSQVVMRAKVLGERAPVPVSRIWTDHRGKRFSAKWVGVDADCLNFILVSDKTGKRYNAMYSKFSKQDQKYLDEQVTWYKSQGYSVHCGWWNKVRDVEAKEVKNGGFPSHDLDEIDLSP